MRERTGALENTFGVEIHDSSMAPRLNEGDVAVVEPSAPLESGRLCLAVFPGKTGTWMVRSYYRHGDTIVLKPENPGPKFQDIEINAGDGSGVTLYRVTKSIISV